MGISEVVDTAIIGGGIVGASIAYHLSKSGQKVILFDRKDRGRATSAGAGIISPPTTFVEDEELYNFQIAAGKYYPQLNDELVQDHGLDTSYTKHPKIVIAIDPDEQTDYSKISSRILDRREKSSYPKTTNLYKLEPSELQDRFPNLRYTQDTTSAIINEQAAKINGEMFTEALLSAGESYGLRVINQSIEIMAEKKVHNDPKQRSIDSITDGKSTWKANNYVLSGGFWSSRMIKLLGYEIPLAPQKGQIIHLYHPTLDTSKLPTIAGFHGHYIVPWSDGTIICGATREMDVSDTNATVKGITELLSEAIRVVPEIENAVITEIRVGIRPYSITGYPILGKIPNIQNLFIATGHGPLGLTLGPYSGLLLSQMILGEPLDFDIKKFSP